MDRHEKICFVITKNRNDEEKEKSEDYILRLFFSINLLAK